LSVSADETILWEVIEEHLDETAFLYGMRQDRLSAPHYTLEDVRIGPEARLLAHLDGLVVAGRVVRERLLFPTLRDEEADPERVAAAALAVLAGEDADAAVDAVVAALQHAQAPRLEALCAALCLAELPQIPQRLSREISKENPPFVLAAMLRVLGAYGTDTGALLLGFLQSEEPVVVEAALMVAAVTRRLDCLSRCERLVDSDLASTRNAAIDASLVMGSNLAWAACLRRASQPTSEDGHCLLLCSLLGSPQEHRRLAALLETDTEVASALWALGFAGRPEYLHLVIPLLDHADPRLSKLAGETFVAVTGCAPEMVASNGAPDEQHRAPLTPTHEMPPLDEEDLDADLAPSAVDLLPVLSGSAARDWWHNHRQQFSEGIRFLAGQPLALGRLHDALRNGSARRRQPWALGTWIASRGQYLVSTDAFCERQFRQLAALASAEPAQLGLLFR
jgi:uncharacterized protein (TIGR02270 family)